MRAWISSMAERSSGESFTDLRWFTIPQTTCNRSMILSSGSTSVGHVGSTVLSSSNRSASYTIPKTPTSPTQTETLDPDREKEQKHEEEILTSLRSSSRIPGRTCFASTTSKGGKSKSRRRGFESSPSSAPAAAMGGEGGGEGESAAAQNPAERGEVVDSGPRGRQKPEEEEEEEDQRGQVRGLGVRVRVRVRVLRGEKRGERRGKERVRETRARASMLRATIIKRRGARARARRARCGESRPILCACARASWRCGVGVWELGIS